MTKHIKLFAYACTALVFTGYQTTVWANELEGRAPDGLEKAKLVQNGEAPERSYSFFYDQGSHLKDLIKAGQYEQASHLYKKHQAKFFDPKKPKYDALLDGLAVSLDDLYRQRFETTRVALLAQPASINPATWPAARAAVSKARQELEVFAPHEALASGSRRSLGRDALAESLQTVDAAWRAIALDAFEKHDIRHNFFTAYPVTFDSLAPFMDEAFIARIEGHLRVGG